MRLEIKKAFAAVILFGALGTLVSPAAAQQTNSKSPQSAAKALYAAWRAKSKTKARRVAETKAIEKLFSTNFINRRKFAGCTDQSETEKGLFTCVYEDATDDLFNVAFETVKKGSGWRVRRVTFAAEN